jgi:hypothetical protein
VPGCHKIRAPPLAAEDTRRMLADTIGLPCSARFGRCSAPVMTAVSQSVETGSCRAEVEASAAPICSVPHCSIAFKADSWLLCRRSCSLRKKRSQPILFSLRSMTCRSFMETDSSTVTLNLKSPEQSAISPLTLVVSLWLAYGAIKVRETPLDLTCTAEPNSGTQGRDSILSCCRPVCKGTNSKSQGSKKLAPASTPMRRVLGRVHNAVVGAGQRSALQPGQHQVTPICQEPVASSTVVLGRGLCSRLRCAYSVPGEVPFL